MTANKHSTRRGFFLQGGAALGAGVAATAGATAPRAGEASSPQELQLRQLRRQLDCAAARDAIRELQLTFAAQIENRNYEAAAELFTEQAHLELSGVSARGKPAILHLLADQYRRQQVAVIHSAYRRNPVHDDDTVTLTDDGLGASATFPVEVELCTSLQEDCTAAQMARLQGHVAERRWETGRLEGQYVRTRDGWRITSLFYRVSR